MIVFSGLNGHPVRVGFLEDPIVRLLNLVVVWGARHGQDVHITSMNDHAHSERSLHYENRAVDLQVQGGQARNRKQAMTSLSNYLKANLELGFDVVFDSPGHYTHIHVEWDIRQREAPSTPRA
jgi:hypothetical protein